ncbi:MAG: hypothetical protein COY39_04925 [Alphaproteobacteria bacterium CG_4_10_14_0_8_um_filter_37_21]|nr:MAG: hypothetical protein COY39_04925 [Alphaproteobacteria bacterium CG_4_10_14_0_8_um_filter_37_21]
MAYQQTKPQDASILIVCNHQTNICNLSKILTNLSFMNITCIDCDGDLMDEIQDERPDLVIVHDVNPGKNAIKLLAQIRQHFSQTELAIVMYSDNYSAREEAWMHNISDYIEPCVRANELKSRLIFHIHNAQELKRLKNFECMMKGDIRSALSLQYSLMPQKKVLTEIQKKYQVKVGYLFKPCQYLSGDLWGILPLDEHRFGVWICDFVSKGLHAALSTFRIHTLIKDQEKNQFTPSLLLQTLNNKLKNLLAVGNFATFLYGVVDIRHNTFTYAAAGSTSPIFYNKKTKKITLGDSSGLPLGIETGIKYAERSVKFDKDTSLLLYSDLLWECLDDLGFSFDDDDIHHFFKTLDGQPVIPYVEKKLDDKNEKLALSDDLTLIEVTFQQSY